jgi:hypothetical protein
MDEQNNNTNIPAEYNPISMWGYVGYMILFAIPCVGLILMFVFGFGGTQNINLRNWARGYLIIYAIAIAISLLLTLLGVGSILSIASAIK